MSRLQALCPAAGCGKAIEIKEELPFYNITDIYSEVWSTLRKYKCGHVFHNEHIPFRGNDILTNKYYSLDQKSETRHYQVDGLRFIEETNFNCLVADQQGLGKTIEALLALREHQDKLLPALVIVKSSTLWQWQKEIKKWAFSTPNGVWMIRSGDSKAFVPPGFKIYLISMDTLRQFVRSTKTVRKSRSSMSKATKVVMDNIESKTNFASSSTQEFYIDPRIVALGLRTVVADEVHSFKNDDSSRSQALVELISRLNIQYKIFLSGTPIVNRASEYFIPLNLLDPINFPSRQRFAYNFLTDDQKRIDPYRLSQFKEVTEKYIIRRERSQVLTDLPPFQRVFEDVLIESELLKNLYNHELDKMEAAQVDKGRGKLTFKDIQGNLMTMRRIIGMAKAEVITDTVKEFLESSEEEKLVIGVHHIDVRDYLLGELAEYRPLSLSGEDSTDRKARIIEVFQRPDRRLMIVNIIAGGTGLNLQFCNNCIILERQWSSTMEEQFEDRFNRYGQTRHVTAAYPVAKKTVDEWFHNLVEEKRSIFGETVAVDFNSWMENGQVEEMVDWATSNRL